MVSESLLVIGFSHWSKLFFSFLLFSGLSFAAWKINPKRSSWAAGLVHSSRALWANFPAQRANSEREGERGGQREREREREMMMKAIYESSCCWVSTLLVCVNVCVCVRATQMLVRPLWHEINTEAFALLHLHMPKNLTREITFHSDLFSSYITWSGIITAAMRRKMTEIETIPHEPSKIKSTLTQSHWIRNTLKNEGNKFSRTNTSFRKGVCVQKCAYIHYHSKVWGKNVYFSSARMR